jgi:hypothetical protein
MTDYVKTTIDVLTSLPAQIEAAELAVLSDELKLMGLREALLQQEDDLLLRGTIDGKNERVREAQLRELTANQNIAVAGLESNLRIKRLGLRVLETRMTATLALAELLARRGA